jgi:hypothetical protein
MTEQQQGERDKDVDGAIVLGIIAQCCEALKGHDPELQSAALADLTATWLRGYQGPEPAVSQLRDELLGHWVDLVRELVRLPPVTPN